MAEADSGTCAVDSEKALITLLTASRLRELTLSQAVLLSDWEDGILLDRLAVRWRLAAGGDSQEVLCKQVRQAFRSKWLSGGPSMSLSAKLLQMESSAEHGSVIDENVSWIGGRKVLQLGGAGALACSEVVKEARASMERASIELGLDSDEANPEKDSGREVRVGKGPKL